MEKATLRNWIVVGTAMAMLSAANGAQADGCEIVNGSFEDDREVVAANGHGY